MNWKYFHMPETETSRASSPLSHLYPVPEPLDNDLEWERFHHLDLQAMPLPELKIAHAQLMMRLAAERDHHPWLLERLQRLEGRIARER
ncbi:MAG: hypothetical protein ABI960_03765 [Candidatus Eisenbacteria bacterium]